MYGFGKFFSFLWGGGLLKPLKIKIVFYMKNIQRTIIEMLSLFNAFKFEDKLLDPSSKVNPARYSLQVTAQKSSWKKVSGKKS